MGTVFRFWAYRTFVFRLLPEAAAPEAAMSPAPRTDADLAEFEREFEQPTDALGAEWDAELTDMPAPAEMAKPADRGR
jgi:hypothetical protein